MCFNFSWVSKYCLGHVVVACLIFFENAKLFSKVLETFYIVTKSVWDFHLFYISANTWYSQYFLF